MHFLFLSCLKATELIEKKLHIKLTLKEKLQLQMHKTMCSACRNYEKHSIIIDKSLKNKHPKTLNINMEEFQIKIKEKLSEK